MGCFCPAISRSICVATSTSSNTTRCLLPLRYACKDLFSSTACAKQVIMNAVNDRDSPVFALWSCKNLWALVTIPSHVHWLAHWPNLIKTRSTYFCADPLRGNMSTRDKHTGEIEADLAWTRLPQMCKSLLLTLPWNSYSPVMAL